MSFILDALKKSESERQRQSGPALFEVKVAPPRHRFAPWMIVLAALLLANVALFGYWMLRTPHATEPAVARAAAAPAPRAEPSAAAASAASAPGAAVAPLAPAVPASATGAPATAPGAPALAGSAGPAGAGTGTAAPSATPAAGAAGPAQVAPLAAAAAADAARPDDLAPAVDPAAGHAPAAAGSPGAGSPAAAGEGVVRATASGLPTYHDAATIPGANLPDLRLDLHVYAVQPAQRFVFLNMMKLHEGESLPQGVRVESITPDGVILSYHGSRFVLLRG